MKTFDEIKNDTQIQRVVNERGNYIDGYLLLRGQKKVFTFVCSIESNWEHVSVGIYKERRKTPTWEDMCAVKQIFWADNEEVHQIHPTEEHYIHRVGLIENILHLWRPLGGWEYERKQNR